MQLRADIQLRSMIKSLRDVVIPAVDMANKPALEQAQLVLATLELMEARLPLQYRFDCDELERLVGFTRRLQQILERHPARPLEAEVVVAEAVLKAARQTDPDTVLACARRLRAGLSEALQAAFPDAAVPTRAKLRGWVLELSGEQLLRDRAWLIAQAWEPSPESIPPVDSLLR